MTSFCVFNMEGRILRYGLCPTSDMLLQAGAGEFVIEGQANDMLEYVVDGVIHPRPVMPVQFDNATVPADGMSAVTLTGIPTDAMVRVRGPATDAFTVHDGTLEMTFDAPGSYRIGIEKFPYRDFEALINAT